MNSPLVFELGAKALEPQLLQACAAGQLRSTIGADARDRIERVLWNDPATGVMRHANAGYPEAIECAHEQGLDLPMLTPRGRV